MTMKEFKALAKAALVPHSNPIESLQTKEKTLVWIFSIVCALLGYAGIAVIIQNVYTPDIDSLKKTGEKLLIGGCRPEPMEALLFRLAIIIIPLSLLGFYVLFSKIQIIKRLARKPFFMLLSVLSVVFIIAMVYYDFVAKNPFGKGNGDIPQAHRDYMAVTNYDFYFADLFLGNHLMLYSFVITPLICCLFFIGIKKYKWQNKKLFKTSTLIIGYAVLGGVILSCVLMDIFYFPYQSENKFDFNSVYYSMTQVYAGVPMLIDHFTSTYGLYPHFLNLVFQITGLSIFKFSFVMAMLLAISFVLNFYCLKQFVGNKVILFLGMFSVIFFPFLNIKFVERFDANFAFFPIRYVIPSVLIFLVTIYFKKKSQFIYWVTFFIMAFFVLWNPEFGIVSYISLLLFHTYSDFYNKEGKINIKKILTHWVGGIAILVVIFYTYKLLIYVFYGSVPDLDLLWDSIFIYGKLGFGMLPMTLVHPWNLAALTLILGFLFSIAKWYKKEIGPKASVVFLLSVLGVGIFFYFQGRSHNWNLALSLGISFMLLAILGDELWAIIKNRNILFFSALFIVFIYIISISLFEIVNNSDKFYELVCQDKDKTENAVEQKIIEYGKDFIANNSGINQKIYVLTLRKYQGLYFDGSKRRSAFNPGIINLFFNSDLTRLENQLMDSSFSVFITPHTMQDLPFMSRSIAAMAATYEYRKGNDFMMLVDKRGIRIPPNVFFGNHDELVLHRKYSDNRIGVGERMNDAFGIKPITLNSDFSVEVLFNSNNQIFDLATLIGNQGLVDANGFAISRVLNSAKCIFAINGTGYLIQVPYGGWVYCVVNIFPDHFEVYINGYRVCTHGLVKPMANSSENLCVGNLGYMHNYVGAISEVAITNKALDSTQIGNTWNEIKNVFTDKR